MEPLRRCWCNQDMKRSLSPRIASAAVLVGATLLMSGVVATRPARAGGIPALQIRDAGGVRIIAEGGGPTTADLRPGVVNASGSFIASTARDATSKRQRTKVTVHNGWTGATEWSSTVNGLWRPEALSPDGTRVFLGSPDASPDPETVPRGRLQSKMVIIERDRAALFVTLPGNFVAEAFTVADALDRRVALIEHIPPSSPTAYRVRILDPNVGRISDPIGKDKQPIVIETMQGTRYAHVWSRDGKAIYTLYQAPNETFVHALDLVTGIAKCLDVPADVGAGAGSGAIDVSNDGTIVVAGRGGVVKLDATSGSTVQHTPKPLGPESVTATALKASGSDIVVSRGSVIFTLDPQTLAIRSQVKLPRPNDVRALADMPYPAFIAVDRRGDIWWSGLSSNPFRRAHTDMPASGTVTVAVGPV